MIAAGAALLAHAFRMYKRKAGEAGKWIERLIVQAAWACEMRKH